MKKILLIGGMILLAGLGYLANQVINGKRHDPEALRERVNQYWEAVRTNDQLTRYHLMTAYAEGHLQPDELQAQLSPQLQVLRYKVGEISMESDGTAEVAVDLELTLPKFQGKGFPRQSREPWAFVGDNWYRGLRKDDRNQIKDVIQRDSLRDNSP